MKVKDRRGKVGGGVGRTRKHVELGEVERGVAVHQGRVAHLGDIQPAAAPRSSRRGAKLASLCSVGTVPTTTAACVASDH